MSDNSGTGYAGVDVEYLLSSVERDDLMNTEELCNTTLGTLYKANPRFENHLAATLQSSGWELAAVMRRSEQLLGLIQSSPVLEDRLRTMFKDCADMNNWFQIRHLNIFQPPGRASPDKQVAEALAFSDAAWNVDYHGDNQYLLKKIISAMHGKASATDSRPFSRQCPVIQSSGTGKSRMVDELAKLIFTIPFNLRKASDSLQLPYPHPDETVRNYLSRVRSPGKAMTASLLFLKFIFEEVNTVISGTLFNIESTYTREHLAATWREHLVTQRLAIYSRAIDHASLALSGMGAKPDEAGEMTENNAHGAETVSALDSLIDTLNGLSEEANEEPEIILCFDDTDILFVETNPPTVKKKTLFDFLCSAIDVLRRRSIFTLTLSTLSSIADLAPDNKLARSARAQDPDLLLHAPITEMPFDVFFSANSKYGTVIPGTMTHHEVIDYRFLARFGRPLFEALSQKMTPQIRCGAFIHMIAAKLVRHQQPFDLDSLWKSDSDNENLVKFAILDVCLCIGLSANHELTRSIESRMVASHMRIAYTIPEHQRRMYSGYPSEPILAEAASRLAWFHFRNRPGSLVLDILQEYLSQGILDQGELGQLVARELLTQAYQKAMISHQHSVFNFSAGCKLSLFLEELFSDSMSVLSAFAHNVPLASNIKLGQAFSDAYVRFTHFVKATDSKTITIEVMWMAYIRGMGIICPNNFEAVDLVIPILFKETDKICRHNMSALLVQVNRRRVAGTEAEYAIDRATVDKYGFFSPPDSPPESATCSCNIQAPNLLPYMTLIMELGVETPNLDISSPAAAIHTTTGKPPVSHPCYEIFAYGCFSSIFKPIKEDEPAYRQFLGLNDEIALNYTGEHFPSSKVSDSVFGMKGANTFHWAKTSSNTSG